MWFHEKLFDNVKLAVEGKMIYKKRSPYQDLRIYETPRLGRMLTLDNTIQTTTKDEFIYHEMLTHPLLFAHPNPEKVLVIGAGDGGVLREILKHPVKEAVIVEIDEDVITLSKRYFPSIHDGAFDNKKVRVIIDNGAKFVQNTRQQFDIVIVDSPDPIGAAKVLFSKPFYKNLYRVLTDNGLMIRQTGSTMFQLYEVEENYKILKTIFPHLCVQLAAIPTYIGGFFSFIIASKKIDLQNVPYHIIADKYKSSGIKTLYYNPDIHFASQKTPNYVASVLKK